MATMRIQNSGRGFFVLLFVSVIAATGLYGLYLLNTQTQSQLTLNAQARPNVIAHIHATAKHGMDAVLIRKCLNENGPWQVWHAKDGRFFFLCQIQDGRWGFQSARKSGGVWDELTSFVPDGDGSLSSLLRYLKRFATRYTKPL